eukprot:scaffold150380_cov28-Tisochrysis_lutea.AAC.6
MVVWGWQGEAEATRGMHCTWAVAMPSCLRNLPSRSHGWASLESGLRRRPSTASRTVRRRTRVPASKPCARCGAGDEELAS